MVEPKASQRRVGTNRRRGTCGFGPADFPYASSASITAGSRIQRARLAYLQKHASYLTSGDGINFYSLVSVVVRTQLICLLIVVPLLSAIFYCIELLNTTVLNEYFNSALTRVSQMIANTQESIFPEIVYKFREEWDSRGCQTQDVRCFFQLRAPFSVLLLVCFSFPVAFVLLSIAASVSTSFNNYRMAEFSRLRLIVTAILLTLFSCYLIFVFRDSLTYSLIVLIVAMSFSALIIAFQLKSTYAYGILVSSSYWFRRGLERQAGRLFPVFILCLTIGTIPVVAGGIYSYLVVEPKDAKGFLSIFGVIGSLSGVISATTAVYAQIKNRNLGFTTNVVSIIAALIFMYFIIVFSYLIGVICFYDGSIRDDAGRYIIFPGLILSITLSAASSVNQTGLHRFYRDRLMETFMPASAAVNAGRSHFSPTADGLLMTELLIQTASLPTAIPVRSPRTQLSTQTRF